MREVLIGQVDYSLLVKIVDTTGAPVTGLTYSDIDLAYARVETDNDVTTSDVTPATLASLTAAHSDWGFIEVSSGDHPGLYRLDIADAVFAAGAWEAVVTLTDASGTDFYAVDIGFRLVSFNAQDGVRLGLTALPNAAADAAGGLPISDAGGLDLDAQIGTDIDAILVDTGTTLDGRIPAALVSGRMDASVGAMAAGVVTEIQAGLATGAALATVATYIDTEVAAIKAKTDNLPAAPAATGDIPTAAQNADAVWDEATSGHTSAGTYGKGLPATGLDAITATEPTGKPTTFPGWVMWLVQRFRRSTCTSTTLLVKKEDGTTVTTQTVGDDGVTESLGAPS